MSAKASQWSGGTGPAAAELGVTRAALLAAIYGGKLTPPQKSARGDYVWTAADLDRARQALATDRRLKAYREVQTA